MKLKFSSQFFYRMILFVAAVVCIYLCLPSSDNSRYIYAVNRPWSYSLLTAPFDIPVHLDSIRAEYVRDSIETNFEPVYKRDVAAEKQALAAYANRLNSTDGLNLTPLERNNLLTQIRAIYDAGIVDGDTYERIRRGELPAVRMIHDNVAISIPTRRYNSARSGYSHLDSVLNDRRYHEAISATGLSELLEPNIKLDSVENLRLRNELLQRAMAPIGVIQQGERIIDKGDIVTPQLYTVLRTYERLLHDRGAKSVVSDQYYPTVGRILYLVILFSALFSFLYFFRPEYYADSKKLLFIIICVTGFSVFAILMADAFTSGLYLSPFTMVPIVVLIFLDSRTAFFCHIITVLVCALVAVFQMEFIFMQFAAGVAAIESIKELSKRSQLLRAAIIVFAAYCLAFVAVEVMQTGDLERISPRMFGYFGVNAVLICFAYLLVYIVEKSFGFTSRVTLVELSDINHPLLRELSEECPGTFQHSMAVSNLASAAANRIGANVQLVRAGALYHDIGKISNPAFFTENQHGVNPHDALSPMQSARVVIGHVTDGLQRAEKAELPAVIRDFIAEHHGRGKARYFYTTYCNEHPDEKVDPAPFTYPGPNPRSRETSILMMSDAVEAASRSLRDYSPESIRGLVNRIIDSQIAEGLHNDSPLSFRDVQEIKEVFVSRLRTIYHSRVQYPTMTTQAARTQASADSSSGASAHVSSVTSSAESTDAPAADNKS